VYWKNIPRVRLYLKVLGGKVDGEVIEDGEERTEGMPEALNRPYPNCVPG
jgi:hypothetical protein